MHFQLPVLLYPVQPDNSRTTEKQIPHLYPKSLFPYNHQKKNICWDLPFPFYLSFISYYISGNLSIIILHYLLFRIIFAIINVMPLQYPQMVNIPKKGESSNMIKFGRIIDVAGFNPSDYPSLSDALVNLVDLRNHKYMMYKDTL